MNPVNRFKYEGFAVGGPYRGAKMMRVGDPVWRLARMKHIKVMPWQAEDEKIEYEDFGRGQYEWDSGIWWWRGWE